MISKALTILANELNQFLKNRFNLSEDPVVLANITGIDGGVAIESENKIVFTMVNIEQEATLSKNMNSIPGSNSNSYLASPPVYLNLFILISAFFQNSNYTESLKMLSSAISFFQQKPLYNRQNTPGLPDQMEKITVEINNLGINEQNNLWGQLGGKYLPSVLYKIRMLKFDSGYPLEIIDNIKTAEHGAALK